MKLNEILTFKEFTLLNEAFGSIFFSEFKRKFSNFNPSFRHDGKTITFNTDEMDKDGLLIHLTSFLSKVGNRIKKDLGDVAAYKMKDDNIVVIKQPQKHGKRYEIELKFAYS